MLWVLVLNLGCVLEGGHNTTEPPWRQRYLGSGIMTRILNVEQDAVSKSYRQLQSSRGSEVSPDSCREGRASALGFPVPRSPRVPVSPEPHPSGVVIHHDQCKLMALVNLVLRAHKHLNHLLRHVQGVCPGAGRGGVTAAGCQLDCI